MAFRIGVIPGDGIGPEVVAEGLKVLDATGIATDRTTFDLGAERYLETGDVLPDDEFARLRGLERVIRYAFERANKRSRRKVTLVHKTNVLTHAGGLWMRAFEAIGAEYPDVGRDYVHVDAACLYFVTQPERFDVVVTDNLFGDILTDLRSEE